MKIIVVAESENEFFDAEDLAGSIKYNVPFIKNIEVQVVTVRDATKA